MPSLRLDESRLRHDLDHLLADCTHLKRLLRQRWTAPMTDVQRRHLRLARRLTELHVLLAWARNRLHVTVQPRELRYEAVDWDASAHAARIAERLLPDYANAVTIQEVQP